MNNFYQQPQGQMGMGMGMYVPNGMNTMYGNIPTSKMTQPLSQEQIKTLRRTGNGFSLQIDEIEFVRAQCTHKEGGKIVLLENPDGTSTCTICGATFRLIDTTRDEVQGIIQAAIDVLQSIKTYYLDIPESYVANVMQIIPLLEKVPGLYEVALHNFAKYDNGATLNQNNGMYGFGLMSAITNPGMGMMGMQQPMMGNMMGGVQQPMYNMNMQQPMMGNMMGGVQQPMMNNMMGGMQQPMMAGNGMPSNGFGYGGAAPEQQQTVQGGQGMPYTKENATAKDDGNVSTKVFNK